MQQVEYGEISGVSFISVVKFIYSEKATKFCEIFTNYLSYVLPVKKLLEISQNFVAFSEYMNFKWGSTSQYVLELDDLIQPTTKIQD